VEILLGICIAIGLSAACGFRVFVPLLVASIASIAGHVTLSPGFEWIGGYPALVAFALATCLEITAYFVPWLDNLLDTIATPAAIVAGIVVTASFVSGMSPFLRWTFAVVAGGGVAGMIQAGTVAIRAASTGTTGGLGNPVVSVIEAGSSTALSILAVLLPVVAGIVVLAVLYFAGRKISRSLARKRKPKIQNA
jgi:hypothetical protein